MHGAPKVGLEALIYPFGLAVCLGVVGRAGLPAEPEQFLPDIACEDAIPVGNDGQRKSVQSINLLQEHFGNLECCEWMCQRKKMGIFGEFVDHHQHCVISP